jgi:hypothetical protein
LVAYYNEIDPYAAQWLRNLIEKGQIAKGDVDERSIVDVKPDDLRGYSQAHFFAGIGGWSIALRLAGWPDDRPVWTGSCPCQPYSVASVGHGGAKGGRDNRDLWPVLFSLVRERCPAKLFGEQVSSAIKWGWFRRRGTTAHPRIRQCNCPASRGGVHSCMSLTTDAPPNRPVLLQETEVSDGINIIIDNRFICLFPMECRAQVEHLIYCVNLAHRQRLAE